MFILQAIEKEKSELKSSTKTLEPIKEMISITEHLNELFSNAIKSAYPDLKDAPVIIAPITNAKFGDYACNSAMPIAQLLKAQGKGANPREIANNIMTKLEASPIIAKTEIAGAGFINVFLDK